MSRPAFSGHEEAIQYYEPICKFVNRFRFSCSTLHPHVLDVGSGSGWSSWCLVQSSHFEVTGIDVCEPATERLFIRPDLHFKKGSAFELPFKDESFHITLCYQTLEHLEAPTKALNEMLRVTRPRGLIIIVGPNLVNPIMVPWAVWKLRFKVPLRRTDGMPSHPYGNTWKELFQSFWRCWLLLSYKWINRNSAGLDFEFRTPDTTPPFTADNDACYLCCPWDLEKYFRFKRCDILHQSHCFKGGTWVAAQKPEEQTDE